MLIFSHFGVTRRVYAHKISIKNKGKIKRADGERPGSPKSEEQGMKRLDRVQKTVEE